MLAASSQLQHKVSKAVHEGSGISPEFCRRHIIVLFKYFNEVIIVGVTDVAADLLDWKIRLLQEVGSFFASQKSYILCHGYSGFFFEYLGQVRYGHIGIC